MNRKSTILVTGASGKVGHEIFKELIEKNYDVIGTYSKKKFKFT
jgi:nucleoside-diphosphate-sugar epimerase